jgi:hypothetical protein
MAMTLKGLGWLNPILSSAFAGGVWLVHAEA